MAEHVVGFLFEDQSFVNCQISRRDWIEFERSKFSTWILKRIIRELTSAWGLILTSNNVVQIAPDGGFFPDLNLPINTVHQASEGPIISSNLPSSTQTILQPGLTDEPGSQPSTSGSQPSTSNALPGPSQSECQGNQDKSWPHKAVLLLIELYVHHKHLFQGNLKKKIEVWNVISKSLHERGYDFNAHLCLKKWDSLRGRFKVISDRNKKTGQGRVAWPYYDRMSDVLHKDPAVNPPVLVSSLSGVQVNTMDHMSGEGITDNQENAVIPSSPSTSAACAKALFSATKETPMHKPTPLRKRKALPAPQWFQSYETKTVSLLERLVEVEEEKNRLLRERNDILRELCNTNADVADSLR